MRLLSTVIDVRLESTLIDMRMVSTQGPELLIGSVLGLLSCLMQCLGFDSPLGIIFPVAEFFPWS